MPMTNPMYRALVSIVQQIEAEQYHSTTLADVAGWEADHEQAIALLRDIRRIAERALEHRDIRD